MIRFIVTLVFAFSVLAASSSHAAKTQNVFERGGFAELHVHADLQCPKFQPAMSELTNASCRIDSQHSQNATRCQVDVGPIVDGYLFLGGNCFAALHNFHHNVHTDWLSKPVLGPPRIT